MPRTDSWERILSDDDKSVLQLARMYGARTPGIGMLLRLIAKLAGQIDVLDQALSDLRGTPEPPKASAHTDPTVTTKPLPCPRCKAVDTPMLRCPHCDTLLNPQDHPMV
jgi:hypothetical protein